MKLIENVTRRMLPYVTALLLGVTVGLATHSGWWAGGVAVLVFVLLRAMGIPGR